MIQDLLEKYNVPVPRYTSYPPANYFNDSFDAGKFADAVDRSNETAPEHLSFYFHIPFCPRLCHYCGCNSFPLAKPDVIERYIAALHKEIGMVTQRIDKGRRIAQIHFGGGTPSILPPSGLKALIDHLKEHFGTIDRPEIAIECHPGYLAESYWKELHTAGFTRISLGIQDFDEEVLKTVNRKPSLMPVAEITALLHALGVQVNMDFLYGLPHQTEKSFAQTIEKAIGLSPDRLVTFSYAHVPWVNKHQLILEKAGLPSGDEKSKMYETARTLLCEAGYQPVGLDHFVRKDDELHAALQNGQLHRNFQGYCTRRTTGQVYAFGVTAISQLSGAYAQNIKDVMGYIERIENGRFATVKGYALSNQEQVAREVIETLMCNYRIDWDDLSARLHLSVPEIKSATAYDEARLQEFADDGIIAFDPHHIRMTAEGTLFVRNIAASLDRLMLNTDKTFSKPV